jgi:hypothetical protein
MIYGVIQFSYLYCCLSFVAINITKPQISWTCCVVIHVWTKVIELCHYYILLTELLSWFELYVMWVSHGGDWRLQFPGVWHLVAWQKICWCFGGIFGFHLQVRSFVKPEDKAMCSSEMLVNFCQTMWHSILDGNLESLN